MGGIWYGVSHLQVRLRWMRWRLMVFHFGVPVRDPIYRCGPGGNWYSSLLHKYVWCLMAVKESAQRMFDALKKMHTIPDGEEWTVAYAMEVISARAIRDQNIGELDPTIYGNIVQLQSTDLHEKMQSMKNYTKTHQF
jgi:hypothetical protein